jgi:hypothetical protein
LFKEEGTGSVVKLLASMLKSSISSTAEKKKKKSWALVSLACNPSYSRGRDQEDSSSKPTQANSSREPISKNPSQKTFGITFGI